VPAFIIDGISHDKFHEHFLRYSLEAGFDPFRLHAQIGESWPNAASVNFMRRALNNP
jgi:hypothetical protein